MKKKLFNKSILIISIFVFCFSLSGCGGGGSSSTTAISKTSDSSSMAEAASVVVASSSAIPPGAPGLKFSSVSRTFTNTTVSGPLTNDGWWVVQANFTYNSIPFTFTGKIKYKDATGSNLIVESVVNLQTSAKTIEFQFTVTDGSKLNFTESGNYTITSISTLLNPLRLTASGVYSGTGAITYTADSSYTIALNEAGTMSVVLNPINPKSLAIYQEGIVTLTASDGWTVSITKNNDGSFTGIIKSSGGTEIATINKNTNGDISYYDKITGKTEEVQVSY